MWFTKVSLNNPVFAAMVMLAFVVLGLFSLQRLQVDQFPNVDFPVVVISTEYPGAAPGRVAVPSRSTPALPRSTVAPSAMPRTATQGSPSTLPRTPRPTGRWAMRSPATTCT